MSDSPIVKAADVFSGHISSAMKNPAFRWACAVALAFLSFAPLPDGLANYRALIQAVGLAVVAYPLVAFCIHEVSRRNNLKRLAKSLAKDEIILLVEYLVQNRACHYVSVYSHGPALSLYMKGILTCPLQRYDPYSVPMILAPEFRKHLTRFPEILGLGKSDIGRAAFKNINPEPWSHIAPSE